MRSNGSEPVHANDDLQATVDDLKAAFATAKPKYYVSRQRFTRQPTADASRGEPLTAGGKPLSDYGVTDGTTLLFKDLGTQARPHWLNDRCTRKRQIGFRHQH